MRKVAIIAIFLASLSSASVFATHENYSAERYRTLIGQLNPVPANWECSMLNYIYGGSKSGARANAVELYESCSGDSECVFYITQGYSHIYNCESALIWINGPVRDDCTDGTYLNPHNVLCEFSCPANGTGHSADYLTVSGNTGSNICEAQANNAICEVHSDSINYNADTDETVLYSPEFTSHFCDADDGAIAGQLPVLSNADKDNGSGCGVGNPCNPSTGNKYQKETDYHTKSLTLTRHYNSNYLKDFGLGRGWNSSFVRHLELSGDQMQVIDATGRGEKWRRENGVWSGDSDSDIAITENNGFTLTKGTGHTEIYNSIGQIVSEMTPNGRSATYQYNSSRVLLSYTNHFGHAFEFTWNNNGHVSTVTSPIGGIFSYTYDTSDNLTGVQFPDGTSRIYHYENATYPNHLTGITDENGTRFSTFTYDSAGRAVSTSHADTGNGPQELFEIFYGQ
jgi:YD repeat-containing protein